MPSRLNETAPGGAFPESSFAHTPLQHLRWLYTRFVQGLFYAAPRGAYHWEPDPLLTELVVSNENVLNAQEVGLRPAVTFTRGPVRFFTLGHDDMLGYDAATGQKKKSVLVPGTISINVCSRNDLESEQVAWIIAEQLWLNRDLLMRAGFFEVGREPAIGSPSPAGSLVANDSGEEWYVTSITCPFQFYRTGSITPLSAQIANSIGASLRFDPRHPPYSNAGPFRGVRDSEIVAGSTIQMHGKTYVLPEQGYPNAPGGFPYAVESSGPAPFSPASDAHGGSPDPAGQGATLQVVPHPLNPAQMVTVRTVRASQQGLRPPSIRGRPIPLASGSVEQSASSVEFTRTVKV